MPDKKDTGDMPAERWTGGDVPDERPENPEDLGRWGDWMYPSSDPLTEGELDGGTHDKERGSHEPVGG